MTAVYGLAAIPHLWHIRQGFTSFWQKNIRRIYKIGVYIVCCSGMRFAVQIRIIIDRLANCIVKGKTDDNAMNRSFTASFVAPLKRPMGKMNFDP